jgi:hypothetical protein
MLNQDKYVIVNATQLDSDLATIATAMKTKVKESKEYQFPTDFLAAIDKMVYDENPNTADDLVVQGNSITAKAGYYPADVSKAVNTGAVTVNALDLEKNPTIEFVGDNIVASYLIEQEPQVSTTNGYVTASEIKVNKCTATGSATKPIGELLSLRTGDNLVINEDGTLTLPNGYYKDNVILKPVDYVTKKTNADISYDKNAGTVTIPAGYYAENVVFTIPAEEETPAT